MDGGAFSASTGQWAQERRGHSGRARCRELRPPRGCGGGGGGGGERPPEPRSDWLARRSGKTVQSPLHLLRPSQRQPPAKGVRERDPRCFVSLLEARGLEMVRRRDSTAPRSHPWNGRVPQLRSLQLEQNNSTCLRKAERQHAWPLACGTCLKPVGNRDYPRNVVAFLNRKKKHQCKNKRKGREGKGGRREGERYRHG